MATQTGAGLVSDINSRGRFSHDCFTRHLSQHLQVEIVLIPTLVAISAGFYRLSQGGLMAKSSLEITRLLINSGADVNVTGDEGVPRQRDLVIVRLRNCYLYQVQVSLNARTEATDAVGTHLF